MCAHRRLHATSNAPARQRRLEEQEDREKRGRTAKNAHGYEANCSEALSQPGESVANRQGIPDELCGDGDSCERSVKRVRTRQLDIAD